MGKRLEDNRFECVPIWLRALGIPPGMMNKVIGKAIGNEVGVFVDMDLEDGSAIGQYLRIKVKLNINKVADAWSFFGSG